MKRGCGKKLLRAGLGLGLAGTPLYAQTINTFTGDVNNRWQLDGNWYLTHQPTETEHAVIPPNKTPEIQSNQGNAKAQSVELQGNAHLYIQANRILSINGSRTDVENGVFSEALAIGPDATLTMEDHTELEFQASGEINLGGTLEIDCAQDCTIAYPTIRLRGDSNMPVVIATFGSGYITTQTDARCVIIGNTTSDVFSLGSGSHLEGAFDIPITFVAAGSVRTAEPGNTINLYCRPKVLNMPSTWTVDGGASGAGNEAKVVVDTFVTGSADFTVDEYGVLEVNRHFSLMQETGTKFRVNQPLGKLRVLKAMCFEVDRHLLNCVASD